MAPELLTHRSSALLPTRTLPRQEHTHGIPPLAPPPTQQRSPPQLPLLTSREELPSLLVSLYKHWLSVSQKHIVVWGWSTDDRLVLASLARISRVHASGDAGGVHCKLPFSVQRKRDLNGWESTLWSMHART